MNEIMKIGNQEITVKEYKGQRVVTFKDIDLCHERPEGTAGRNFRENKKFFIESEDYFYLAGDELKSYKQATNFVGSNARELVLITQQGYTMLTKSLTDDLAWAVQRELVNNYFNPKANVSELSPMLRELVYLETEQKRQEKELNAVKEDMQDIRDIIVLNPTNWKEESRKLIAKIAQEWGGNHHIQDVYSEIYKSIDEELRVSIGRRLTYKRQRMAEAGGCKTAREKLSKLDIIADDPKLINGFISKVKELAIKAGVSIKDIA